VPAKLIRAYCPCGGAPFVEPHEEEGDIWKGMVAFIDQILKKR
jgi:hypothetical protein